MEWHYLLTTVTKLGEGISSTDDLETIGCESERSMKP